MDYKEQILDVKWQKKRLNVLKLHKFTCEVCGAKDKTLHVHHTRYIKGRKIWEYHSDVLMVLCADCHLKEHNKNLYKLSNSENNALNYFIEALYFKDIKHENTLQNKIYIIAEVLQYDNPIFNLIEHYFDLYTEEIKLNNKIELLEKKEEVK